MCRLRLYEAGRIYSLPRAAWRPLHWTPPSTFRPPEVLTEVEVIEAEAELKVLQRHVLQVVDPKMGV
ncbi:MAG: hypothetical protein WBV66_05185 [Pseudolabrys sp.]